MVSYEELTLHIVPGPRSASYFLPFLLLFLALLVPPSLVSFRQLRYIVVPVILSIQLHVWKEHRSFDVISINNTLGIFMLLALHDVKKDFKYVERKDCIASAVTLGEKKQADIKNDRSPSGSVYTKTEYPDALWPRTKWSLLLMGSSLRLNNWLIGDSSHDARQPSMAHYSDWIPLNGIAEPLPFRVTTIGSIYTIPTTRKSKFGLRSFWGTFWHQNMRYITSAPGIAIVSWLRLPRTSSARYIVVVASSFFWSGVVHMGVVPPQPLTTSRSVTSLRLQLAAFFWLQSIGIGMEVMFQRYLQLDQSQTPGEVSRPSNAALRKSPNQVFKQWLWRIAVMSWTVAYLLATARWTIYPVACELDWWKLNRGPFLYLWD